jgi:hypothetical protein
MSFVLEVSCWVYKRMLPLYADNLRYRYGDEMEQLFREQLMMQVKKGPRELPGFGDLLSTMRFP